MSDPLAKSPPLSGIVICLNEADNIARCLESLSFCDEIVVVDSGSSDGTREIALKYTDRVIEQPFLGMNGQKNFALAQAKHDWVINIDADEAVSPELAANIRGALARNDGSSSGYSLDRLTYYLGVWQDRGEWYPDWRLRVFRRSRARFAGRDPHDHVALDGRSERLAGRLLHWNYRDISDHLQRLDSFSSSASRSLAEEGRRFRLRDLLLRPPARFLKSYLLRQGFRRGIPGLVVSIAGAFYVFMKYAKLWERERLPKP